MAEIILSIVTPTYNRSHLLWKCFESLKMQTCNLFEWIIVDDGSTDQTELTVREIMAEAPDMNIQYVHKLNGGKHTAMNASHDYIRGKYVLILDSDDCLTNDAVQLVISEWKKYQLNRKLGTIVFLKGDFQRNPRAYGEKERVLDDYRTLKLISVTTTDCCEVFRADLFIKYPYTEFPGEKFLSESELWNMLAENGYKMMYINTVIYLCEYLEDGLTAAGRKMHIRNPLGGMCTSKHFFETVFPLKLRIKKALLYICYGYFAGLTTKQILTKDKGHSFLKTVWVLPGYIMYRIWNYRYSS